MYLALRDSHDLDVHRSIQVFSLRTLSSIGKMLWFLPFSAKTSIYQMSSTYSSYAMSTQIYFNFLLRIPRKNLFCSSVGYCVISEVNYRGTVRSSVQLPVLNPSFTWTFNVSAILWEIISTVCWELITSNTSLVGYILFRYAGTCSLGVFWQWLHYRSQVLYVRFSNRSRIFALQIIGNGLVTLRVLFIKNAPVPWSTRLIRVVDLRHFLRFYAVTGNFLHTVMVSQIAVLCRRTNDRTIRDAIVLTRSTSTWWWKLQDVHQMAVWWTSGRYIDGSSMQADLWLVILIHNKPRITSNFSSKSNTMKSST